MIVTRVEQQDRVINVRADIAAMQRNVELNLAEPLTDGSFWIRWQVRLSENEALALAFHLDKFAEADTVRSFGGEKPHLTALLPEGVMLKLQFTNERGQRQCCDLKAHHALNLSANLKACADRLKEERQREWDREEKHADIVAMREKIAADPLFRMSREFSQWAIDNVTRLAEMMTTDRPPYAGLNKPVIEHDVGKWLDADESSRKISEWPAGNPQDPE